VSSRDFTASTAEPGGVGYHPAPVALFPENRLFRTKNCKGRVLATFWKDFEKVSSSKRERQVSSYARRKREILPRKVSGDRGGLLRSKCFRNKVHPPGP